ITALLALLSLGAVFGAVLGFAAVRFKTEGNPIADQINELLPQTQCGQCGFPGCRPYSQAIADGEAINKCPPGGEGTIQALADLLDVEVLPLDEEHAKLMHTVIVSECTGCDLCVEPCPVDCIDMLPQQESLQTWHWDLPDPVVRSMDVIATDAKQGQAA
ncbi:UNVERIFIED_CONTAM: hypothetical protein GTU68_008081, partial [Idotea baltica]|nr:hypothetical protein [Idotea baltica]